MRVIASIPRACGLLLVLAALPVHAAITLHARVLAAPGIAAHDVRVVLAPEMAQPGVFALHLSAAAVAVPALGWKQVGMDVTGTLQRQGDGRWHMQAPLRLRAAPGRALRDAQIDVTLDPLSDTAVIVIDQGATRIDAALPMDAPLHVQLQLTALPLSWLGGALGAAMPGASVRNGSASGTIALDADAGSLRVSGRLGVEGLAAFAQGGSVAAQGFGLRGDFNLQHDAHATRLDFDGALRGGELLAGSFYAQLPARDAPLDVNLTRDAAGTLRISRFDYQDGNAVALDASMALGAKGGLDSLVVRRANIDLARAIPRYASTWLQSHGLPGFQGMGQAQVTLDWQRGVLNALQLQLHHVDMADTSGRFAIAGLNGALDWRSGTTLAPTTLGWRAASIYRVPLGTVQMHLRDAQGLLTLVAPAQIPLLGGNMLVQHFSFAPAGTQRTRLSTGLAFTGVSLGELSGALGWPAFRGTLGGAIPDLRWQDGRAVLQGGLSMQVFGGYVAVTRMSLAHLFGVAPELGADLSLHGIELAPLTSVFDFGEITGKLDGNVQGLRLVAWHPVAFKAELHTAGGGRISQRAVKNLTSVGGGGGLAGGIQGAVLSLFSTFGYKHIGLSCTLANDVCTMGGIKPADGGGYSIVEGDGLPYIHIIGHQTRVDWSTLLSRLQAATTGQGPVIR